MSLVKSPCPACGKPLNYRVIERWTTLIGVPMDEPDIWNTVTEKRVCGQCGTTYTVKRMGIKEWAP